jgi:hypothetical protein
MAGAVCQRMAPLSVVWFGPYSCWFRVTTSCCERARADSSEAVNCSYVPWSPPFGHKACTLTYKSDVCRAIPDSLWIVPSDTAFRQQKKKNKNIGAHRCHHQGGVQIMLNTVPFWLWSRIGKIPGERVSWYFCSLQQNQAVRKAID